MTDVEEAKGSEIDYGALRRLHGVNPRRFYCALSRGLSAGLLSPHDFRDLMLFRDFLGPVAYEDILLAIAQSGPEHRS